MVAAGPMNESEVIIELGAEGGSIALYGIRTQGGWLFSRKVIDWTPELIDEEPMRRKSAIVDSWEAALELLDQYPWFKLYPTFIHPDFRQKVWSAVQERLHNNSETLELEFKRWHDFCSPH
jgi:hypothetical protein